MRKILMFATVLLFVAGCERELTIDKTQLTHEDLEAVPSYKANQGKVWVCHKKGNGTYSLIHVNANALPGHLAHGDIGPAKYEQGFETDASGWFDSDDSWYGTVNRVSSGTNGISSSEGGYHAVIEGDATSAPFTRFDGYQDTWTGTFRAEIDIYLDPSWGVSQGFDYTVAGTRTNGSHLRDFIFHVNHDASTGKLLVGGSNNTNFAPREDLENHNHYEITSAGWYTFQHVFRDQSGSLAVDLNLLDANGNVLFTETRNNASDLIPSIVGGNRYGWFTFINVTGGIAADEQGIFRGCTY